MKQIPKLLLLLAPVVLCPVTNAEDDAATLVDLVTLESQELGATEEISLLGLDAFEGSTALSDDELGSQRARENIEVAEVTINDQDQNGDVTENVAIGNTNGGNLINGGAFTNASGVLSTVQNSGNNVLIQSSTIINVSVDAATN